jgi:hypothetical protein
VGSFTGLLKVNKFISWPSPSNIPINYYGYDALAAVGERWWGPTQRSSTGGRSACPGRWANSMTPLSSGTLSNTLADPDPSDPYVFGPSWSGSGSISQRYESWTGSFYHQANSKLNLDSYCFVTSFWLFILKNDVNVLSKRNKQKNFFFNSYLLASWRSMTKIAGSGFEFGSVSQRQRSADPDPHQNIMDPDYCPAQWDDWFVYPYLPATLLLCLP